MGWTTEPPTRVKVLEAYSYDADYQPAVIPYYDLRKAPPGMTVNHDTGLVEWTPLGTQVGLHKVELTFADATNESLAPIDTQAWSITTERNYPAPLGRSFDLIDMVPRINVQEDDQQHLAKFLGALQVPLGDVLSDVDAFSGVINVDEAEEKFVDLLLDELGNPFKFDLDLQRKRALVQSLPVMWQKLGTAPGMIDTIRFFLGITVTIDDGKAHWILGDSLLGDDTIFGNTTSQGGITFTVVSPVVLDQEQRDLIGGVCDFMKPAHTIYAGIEEP